MNGTLTEAIDTFGWVLLLAIFEFETTSFGIQTDLFNKQLLTFISLVGYSIIIYSAVNYGLEKEWLDLANSIVWILIVMIITYDIYKPSTTEQGLKLRVTIKTILYSLIFLFALKWLIDGELLDFYDAVMWILAFFVIELNIFKFESFNINKK